MKTICLASDHRGFKTKMQVKEKLAALEYNILDVGTASEDRIDGFKFAKLACDEVAGGNANFAVLICGTGIAMCMAASKIKGIRVGQIFSRLMAERAKQHNNLNALCFGAEILSAEEIFDYILTFDKTEFLGGEYQRRIDEIEKLK